MYCSNCINTSTNCTSCPQNYLLYNNICYSTCPQNTYQFMNSSENKLRCVDCNPNCISCEGEYNNCTSCSNDSQLYNHSCIKGCPDKFIGSNSSCISCNSTCTTCVNNSNYCVSCGHLNFYYDSIIGICFQKKSCGESEFFDETTDECHPCYPSCFTCNGPTFNNCTSCKKEKILLNSSCICGNNTFDEITSCGGLKK